MKLKPKSSQVGSSLLEIMIAIVITVIGLLGVAALQINSLKFQKTASQRSVAMQSAYDISERIRANGLAGKAGTYNYLTAYASTVASPPTVPTCSGICGSATVAAVDRAEWLLDLSRQLVGGAGNITPNASATALGVQGVLDVTIMWQEPGFTGTDLICSNSAAPGPGAGVRCYVVTVVL